MMVKSETPSRVWHRVSVQPNPLSLSVCVSARERMTDSVDLVFSYDVDFSQQIRSHSGAEPDVVGKDGCEGTQSNGDVAKQGRMYSGLGPFRVEMA
ncbi:hypothetical protein Mp_7g01610 [Marchantia polymorpha subsp. ruderalis]|uniref:Uncharacterized protein n=2 Tax=Marchantia polymorpha TaxID=3197 RepID=A0AAF6BV36_MARPO|nr:hypothetical protein MARPO_0099s0034 [Marchantia polymorpha]BBN15870.1 hypothetical protein Mp_7g01610 [Marchantia polymorpha subsp. ruderalis]|eukprot:PTQ32398.1 hypothetical protein MARPO_0099s0034 [Marchantia polymorpha]